MKVHRPRSLREQPGIELDPAYVRAVERLEALPDCVLPPLAPGRTRAHGPAATGEHALADPKVAARSVRRFVAEFSAADPATSAVEDLLHGRRGPA